MNKEGIQENTTPLYQQILAAATDRGLPEDFNLVKPEKPGQRLRFADGAWDGIFMYHMSHSGQETGNLSGILMMCSDGREKEAEAELEKLFLADGGESMLKYIDTMQDWIIRNQEKVDAGCLYRFSMHLLTESRNPECVKFGLSILELLNVEEDEEVSGVVRTLALSDEFTLFCMYVLRKREDGNQQLFELARKVHGWGRIFLVEELEPQTEEIRLWLLKEGWRNTVATDYSALPCAEKGGLAHLLEQTQLTPEEYETAGALVAALLPEGPTAGISAMENREALLERYLHHSLAMAGNLADYETVSQIRDYLEDCGWEEDCETLHSACRSILDSEKCRRTVSEAVRQGEGFDLAKSLGLEYAEMVMNRVRKDFEAAYHLIYLLMPLEKYAGEVTALFESRLPLDSMATGPADEMGFGKEWQQYSILGYILQFLGDYPGMGEALVLCGLNAPVINNRNLALNVLEAWREKGREPGKELCRALESLKDSEVDEKLRERLEGFSSYTLK